MMMDEWVIFARRLLSFVIILSYRMVSIDN